MDDMFDSSNSDVFTAMEGKAGTEEDTLEEAEAIEIDRRLWYHEKLFTIVNLFYQKMKRIWNRREKQGIEKQKKNNLLEYNS